MLPQQPEDAVYISSIIFRFPETLNQPVDRIILRTTTGSFLREIEVEVSPGQEYKQVFYRVLQLSSHDQLTISTQYQSQQVGTITVDLSKVMAEAQNEGDGKKTYVESHKDIEVAISIPYYLTPTERAYDVTPPSDDILRICPRFRLLVIGNSGAGKSTLIKKLFGVKNVHVSDYRRGEADINCEFTATNGLPFVLHDSLGFEAGDRANLEQVKSFIRGRQQQENPADRLHAVWVCLAVPYAKGRFTEAGTEEFLRDRKNILGDIPVVVALTQLDLLDRLMIMRVLAEGTIVKSIQEAKPHIEPRRDRFLSEWCTQPLLRVAERGIPHVAVSTESKFELEPTLNELMNTTISKIEHHIETDPSYAVAIERARNKRRT